MNRVREVTEEVARWVFEVHVEHLSDWQTPVLFAHVAKLDAHSHLPIVMNSDAFWATCLRKLSSNVFLAAEYGWISLILL